MKSAIEIIKDCMKESGIKQIDLAKKVKESKQIVSFRLKNAKDLKFGVFVKYLSCLGYEVVIKKREEGEKNE